MDEPILWQGKLYCATGAGGTLRDDELIMAVIEAAKAFIADAPDDILVPWHDLRRAVEALQEVE